MPSIAWAAQYSSQLQVASALKTTGLTDAQETSGQQSRPVLHSGHRTILNDFAFSFSHHYCLVIGLEYHIGLV
ncbi:hypothetical protein CBOM_07415 [Ceraceosorus bombacis]|uniref:Uncharacterized protein n=1 Tax=Ceraceosorus bombacis TaxID=401625 RepID=A0A0P1BBB9_9BASI|nr:hypothetical protein CBOM_07415 [Ceraceosorus bombacis]